MVSIGCIANNKLPVYKTVTIDITERKIKLPPTKCFNAWLPHHSGRFATNPDYFFAQFIIEQKKVSDGINIALKKVYSQFVTA